MLAAIHQPHYLPWLRYFEKIARADVFIVLDTAQFNKNGWQNRNRIKTGDGPMLLTVPVHAHYQQTLDETHIDNTRDWRRKHARALEQAYAKAPHYALLAPLLSAAFTREWERLNDLNRFLNERLCALLGIRTRIVYASDLNVPGAATERLIGLLKTVGADSYYSGSHALDVYLDAHALEAAGIALELQSWSPPIYPQGAGDFIPDLSIVDMLAHCGPQTLPRLLGAR